MVHERLGTCSDLYIHWDTNYWYSVYIFLILQGALLVAYTQILVNPDISDIIDKESFLEKIAISGVILTILWIVLLNRKFAFIYWSQEELKKLSGFDIWKNVNSLRKNIPYLSFIPSSTIMNYFLPIGFIMFWIYLENGILDEAIIIIICFILSMCLIGGYKFLKEKK